MTSKTPLTSAYDVRLRLARLAAERLDAIEAGLDRNAVYMRELEQDLSAAHASYVGLAVTEMATLRGQLGGPQLG